MTPEQIKDYLLNELKDQKTKYLRGEESYYGYIWLICNDIGIVEED